MDKSVERLEFYFKCKKISPEFFKNRDVKCQKVQETLNTLNYVLLPTTSDGSFLLLHRLSQFEPKKYNFDDAVKVFIMVSGLTLKSKSQISVAPFHSRFFSPRIGYILRWPTY